MIAKIVRKLNKIWFDLLKVDSLRYYVCYSRWLCWRSRMKFHRPASDAICDDAIDHNLGAFQYPRAAFGMAGRMGLILYPLAALLRKSPDAAVLIVGPRTEDDILWARALGMRKTRGLDLMSYSPHVDIGDMHQTAYPAQSYDAVVFGWVLAYSTRPAVAIAEAKRLLKPGGLLGIGMESIAPAKWETVKASRENDLNDLRDLREAVAEEVIFKWDPQSPETEDIGVIFQLR